MFKFMARSGAFLSALQLLMANDFRRVIGPSITVTPSPGFRKRASSRGKKMMKNPPNRTGWFQRNATISPMPITERMLMRHGWYRRKLRKEGVKLDPNAKNSMVLTSDQRGSE